MIRFDTTTRQWSHVAPMSTQRSTAGVAVLNNKLYALGGRDGRSCLFTRIMLRIALTLVTIRILVPAQRGELRPAHEQVESGRQYVQAERWRWGRFDFILVNNSTCCKSSDIVMTVFSFIGGGCERLSLCHRWSRCSCCLKSPAVKVQLHGKVEPQNKTLTMFSIDR